MMEKIKKILKRIKKFFKRITMRIRYKLNPNSLSKKQRKKIKKEKEISAQYSWWGNVLRTFTGCRNLRVEAYA